MMTSFPVGFFLMTENPSSYTEFQVCTVPGKAYIQRLLGLTRQMRSPHSPHLLSGGARLTAQVVQRTHTENLVLRDRDIRLKSYQV